MTDATTRTMEIVFGGGEQTSVGNNSPSPRSSDTTDVKYITGWLNTKVIFNRTLQALILTTILPVAIINNNKIMLYMIDRGYHPTIATGNHLDHEISLV